MENVEPAKTFDEEGLPVQKLRYRKKDLRIACEKGDLDRLKDLISRGVSVDAFDRAKKSALMYACVNGHNEIVDFLLEHNVSFDAQDTHGRTALIHACEQNRKDIVELLMKHGADVNEKIYKSGYNNGNALTHACSKGYKQIVEILIDYKADLEFEDRSKNTALMYAFESGHKEIIELLLRNKVHINKKNNDNKLNKTGMLIACKTYDEDIIKLLVENGADISSRDYQDGKTLLAVACSDNKFDIAMLLISYGSDIFTKDNKGKTLLMHAIECCLSLRMVEFFIGKGVDVNEPDKDGKTPLMYACSNRREDIVELLIKEGADIKKKTFTKQFPENKSVVNSVQCALTKGNSTTERGTTALICASSNGHVYNVDLLLQGQLGGDYVNVIDENGETALIHAARNKHVKVVRRLIEYGACDVNLVSETRGETALHCGCINGSTKIAEILLANGAKPCLKDGHGRSPFWYAVRAGLFEIVKLMVKKYTIDDLDDQISEKQTALMVACEKDWDNIVDLLLKHGANPELFDHGRYNAIAYSLLFPTNNKCFELLVDYGVDLNTPKGHVFTLALERLNFEALEILANSKRLIVNGRLDPICYREPVGIRDTKTMAVLVRLGLFEWKILSSNNFNLKIVITDAISLGICPGKVKTYGQYCSLLSLVKEQPNYEETLDLMLQNLYFYPEDYSHLLKFKKCFNYPPDYLVDFLSEPLSLEKWSFLAVSQAVALAGPPHLRWNRVNALSIPVVWKRKLMFGNDKVFD